MAKPILIIKLPFESFKDLSSSELAKLTKAIKKDLNHEYHTIITHIQGNKPEFQCLNDNKGLKDVDITKLVNKFYHENQTKESSES